MFRNYLTVALRNIANHKLYSFINIAGLAVALACAILIMLFVRDDLSYDKDVPGHESIFRAGVTFYAPGREPLSMASSMYPLADAMRTEIGGVLETLRLTSQRSAVKYGDRSFFEPIQIADSNLFTMLGFRLLKGDPAVVLARPDTIVVSETFSKKYFGSEDPIGKTLVLDSNKPVEVSGVMADLPHNSHLAINAVIPLGSKADRQYGADPKSQKSAQSWTNANFYTYARLAAGTSIQPVLAQMPDMLRRHVKGTDLGFTADTDMAQIIQFSLVPYGDLHFDNKGGLGNGTTTPSDWTTVYGFSLIAVLIVFIAAINFMNLATARATQRAREVGMRKVVGAKRRQLMLQFLGESVLISLFSLALALAIVELLLPSFARFVDRPIAFGYLSDWDVSLGALALAVLTGLLGGIYPALVLSGFRPAAVLKSNRSGQSGSGTLRAVLVVLQFAISITLGVTAAVVYGQTLYARSFDVGFKRDNMLILTGIGRDQVVPVRETLRNELKANPSVLGVAGASDNPFSGNENNTLIRTPEAPTEPILIRQLNVEPEFFDVYGIRLLAGRSFSRERGEDVDNSKDYGESAPDGLSIIVNESAIRRLGYGSPQDAIGKVVREDSSPGSEAELTGASHSRVIVGVVSDFHFDGLRNQVLPTYFSYNPNALNHFTISIRGTDVKATADFVRETWARLVPDLPVRLAFLDDTYQALYDQDQKRGEMFGLFTGFAILIACLGLFGLASFTAERRTKEIGVRKVFGARVRDIVGLLLWQFSKPVLIANLIAWPIAWYYLNQWLNGFAYRIDLSPLYFAAAGLAALVIAWGTVTLHSLRVARSKPVNALRYE